MSKKTNEMMTVKVRVASRWCDGEAEEYTAPIKGKYPAWEWLYLHQSDFRGLFSISDNIMVSCYKEGEKESSDDVYVGRLRTGCKFPIYDSNVPSGKMTCMVLDKSWDSHIEYVVVSDFGAGTTGKIDPLLAALYREREGLEN